GEHAVTTQKRRAAATVVAILGAICLLVAGTPSASADSSESCTDPGSSTPVLLVHGWSGDFTGWTQMAAELRSMSGVSVDDSFDYGHVNDQWVTHPDISKALAQRIDCLAHRSTVNGGNGKVVIVAHSMGGLATRCASSTSCSGGPDITGKLGAVITLGTPNEGSFLRGNSVQSGAEQVVLKSMRLNCWAFARVSGDLCDMRRVMEGPGSTAFTPGSPELKNLPKLPSSVPIAGIAGQVAVTTSLFGRTVTLAGNAGDLVVSVPSAHAAANKVGDLGGPSTVTCSTTMPITRNWALPPCWHGAETSAPDFLAAVRAQVQIYKDKVDNVCAGLAECSLAGSADVDGDGQLDQIALQRLPGTVTRDGAAPNQTVQAYQWKALVRLSSGGTVSSDPIALTEKTSRSGTADWNTLPWYGAGRVLGTGSAQLVLLESIGVTNGPVGRVYTLSGDNLVLVPSPEPRLGLFWLAAVCNSNGTVSVGIQVETYKWNGAGWDATETPADGDYTSIQTNSGIFNMQCPGLPQGMPGT
ncbi:MAG: hypothetical protein Q8P61_03065, partial [Candidatus Nanopelagicales bacterium]|nr:hypothetical protein [Candidatus Nanopelagicales bacterium]